MDGKTGLHRRLGEWYAAHGRRDLPWRNTRDPYAIYLSEVMLQQTQVQTVLGRFYVPFLERFPSLSALAEAPEREVLNYWEGLGYYSRARNLHKAAKLAAPALPDTVEGLLALPGIGRNTAHAVAAFAFRRPVPVLEANVKRVVSRFFALEHPSDTVLWDAAFRLMGAAEPFDYNQAMMDVGAMICRPRQPLCGECPLAEGCLGKARPEAYPGAKVKKAVPVRRKCWVAVTEGEGVYLFARQSRFLGGLYGLVEWEEGSAEAQTLRTVSGADFLGGVEQTYSHFKLRAELWRIEAERLRKAGLDQAVDWRHAALTPLGSWRELPTSGADQKALRLVNAYEKGKIIQQS